MCYSPEVSLGTFLFVGAICIYLWQRNRRVDRAISLILITIVVMQLIEFFLWMNQDPACNWINRIATYAIPITLYLQILSLPLIMLWLNASWLPRWSLIGLAAILLLSFPLFISNLPDRILSPCTFKGAENHLEWPIKYNEGLLYHTITTVMYASLKDPSMAILFLAGYWSSYLYTWSSYGRDWSSVWCHAANGMAIGALFL